MRTEHIIELHRGEYEKLFAKSRVVTSCPGTFFWAGEHAVLRGIPAVCQHVPLRVYVGLEPTGFPHEQEARPPIYGTSFEYRFAMGRFETRDLESSEEFRQRSKEVLSVLGRICDREGFKERSFSVHVLSELPPGAGCNWSGAFSAALALGLLVLNDRVAFEDIATWEKQPVSSLASIQSFDKTNRIAWEIETVFHGGSASGYGAFTSLAPTGQPVVYFTEERRDDDPRYPPIDVTREPEVIYDVEYGGFSFVEKGWIREDQEWPILFGLIGTGTEKSTGSVIDYVKGQRSDEMEAAARRVSGCVENTPDGEFMCGIERQKLPLVDLCIRAGDQLGERLQDQDYWSLATAVAEVFGNLQILLEGKTDDAGKRLASSIRCVNAGLTKLGLDWPQGALVRAGMTTAFIRSGVWSDSAVKFVGGGKGGSLLLATCLQCREGAKRAMREQLQRCVEGLARTHSRVLPEPAIHWLSDEGFEAAGARVEKPRQRNDRFGTSAAADCGQDVVYFARTGRPISVTLYEDGLARLKNNPDILFLDVINGDARVGGVAPDANLRVVTAFISVLLHSRGRKTDDAIRMALTKQGRWRKSWEEHKNVVPHLRQFARLVQLRFPGSRFELEIVPSELDEDPATKRQSLTLYPYTHMRLKRGSVPIYIVDDPT